MTRPYSRVAVALLAVGCPGAFFCVLAAEPEFFEFKNEQMVISANTSLFSETGHCAVATTNPGIRPAHYVYDPVCEKPEMRAHADANLIFGMVAMQRHLVETDEYIESEKRRIEETRRRFQEASASDADGAWQSKLLLEGFELELSNRLEAYKHPYGAQPPLTVILLIVALTVLPVAFIQYVLPRWRGSPAAASASATGSAPPQRPSPAAQNYRPQAPPSAQTDHAAAAQEQELRQQRLATLEALDIKIAAVAGVLGLTWPSAANQFRQSPRSELLDRAKEDLRQLEAAASRLASLADALNVVRQDVVRLRKFVSDDAAAAVDDAEKLLAALTEDLLLSREWDAHAEAIQESVTYYWSLSPVEDALSELKVTRKGLTREAVQKARRQQARKKHPDILNDGGEAMRRVNVAADRLLLYLDALAREMAA